MIDERIDLRDGELAPLTDSLVSCIRWRLSDYEAMLRCEMDLLLDRGSLSRARELEPAASGSPRPQP